VNDEGVLLYNISNNFCKKLPSNGELFVFEMGGIEYHG
jgi:hypothetical protein